MTLRTNFTPLNALACIGAALAAGIADQSAAGGIISGLSCATMIGVWRALPFLGQIVELKQAEAMHEPEDQGYPHH